MSNFAKGKKPVKNLERTNAEELRILLCIQFDRRATPAEVSALKSVLVDSPNCIHSIEITGGFDLIAEFAGPSMAWYKSWLASLAEPFARVVSRYEANFVLGRAVRRTVDEDAIWVPESEGFRRIDSELIDKVTAEGDYVRIHSQGESWMLHETMKSVSHRLASADFIRIHRSTIVRYSFISRVMREGGHWIAHLIDGSNEAVARSHVVEALDVARSHSRVQAQARLPRGSNNVQALSH